MRYKGFGRVGRIYKHIEGKNNFTQNYRNCLERIHRNGASRGRSRSLPEGGECFLFEGEVVKEIYDDLKCRLVKTD